MQLNYTVMTVGFANIGLGLGNGDMSYTIMGAVLVSINALYNLYKISKAKQRKIEL